MGKGTIQEAVTDRSGITGEKMELDGYCVVEGAYTTVYNHMGKNQLCTIAAFNKESRGSRSQYCYADRRYESDCY